MSQSVFFEVRFFILLACSLLGPALLLVIMWRQRILGPIAVLGFGVMMILLSAVDFTLLQQLRNMARLTPSVIDDKVFASEISTALYLLPALFAGIGMNLVSHVLIRHLGEAERRFDAGN